MFQLPLYVHAFDERLTKGSSSKVPFNKEENGHLSCVTGISPCEPKLKRDFEEFPKFASKVLTD